MSSNARRRRTFRARGRWMRALRLRAGRARQSASGRDGYGDGADGRGEARTKARRRARGARTRATRRAVDERRGFELGVDGGC